MLLAPRTFFPKFFLSCHFCLKLSAPSSEMPSLNTLSRFSHVPISFSVTLAIPKSFWLFVYIFISFCPAPLWGLFCLISDCVPRAWNSPGMKWINFEWINQWMESKLLSLSYTLYTFKITEIHWFLYSCHVEINGMGIWFV